MRHRLQIHVVSELPQNVGPVLVQNKEAECSWPKPLIFFFIFRNTEDFFGGSEQSDGLRILNRLVLDVCLCRYCLLGPPRHCACSPSQYFRMAWCCGAPTPKLTDLDQEGQKQADTPQPQEMSTNLLVSTGSNLPSPEGQVCQKYEHVTQS